jgi:hypothetical protein
VSLCKLFVQCAGVYYPSNEQVKFYLSVSNLSNIPIILSRYESINMINKEKNKINVKAFINKIIQIVIAYNINSNSIS